VRNAITFALAVAVMMTAPSVAQAAPKNTPALAQEQNIGRSRLSVRVYDTGTMPAADQTVALRAAAGVLAAAGIDVTWLPCGDEAVVSLCDRPLAPGELSVRFASLPAAPSAHGQLQLGYSLVDTRAHEGTLATVYVDRVQWLAGQAGSDSTTLLGFAVAHELGHLLLGTNAHATSGLMRALWSRGELQHAKVKDWLFSRDEGARMRASLERRNGLRFSEHDATGCTASRGGDADASAGCRPAAVAAALRGVAAGADR
jgi:hypothetical protein